MQIVNAKRICFAVLSLLYIGIIAGCSSNEPKLIQEGPINSETYVATIDGDPAIKLGEVLHQMVQMTVPGTNKESTPENAYNEVLYRKLAEKQAYTYEDYDPAEIHRLAKNRLHDVLMHYMYEDYVGSQVVIAESSVDSLYNASIASFSIPERRRVTHILLSGNPKAWEAAGEDITGLDGPQLLAKAKTAIHQFYAEIQAGADIAEIAAKHSHDSNSKARRGDSDWFTREEMVDEFSNAAFSLPAGRMSKPFSSVYGWHILRVDSIAPGEIQPLDSLLREKLRGQLKGREESRVGQIFVDSVFKLASFDWNEPLLEKNPDEYDPHDWVCIVNKTDSIEAVILRENEMMYRTRVRNAEINPEIRKNIVITRATPWVLSSVARQLGYADRDTIKSAYQAFRRAEIVNRIFRDRIPLDLNWTDEQLEDYYNSHVDVFKSDKPIQVQHIVFEDTLKAVEALREIRGGADFKETAMKYYPGEEDFKKAAFDLGWISRDDVSPELYDRAWLTPVGEVSGPQRTQWGFHLIKVLDRKSQLDFQGAKNEVRRMMREEAYKKQEEKWIAELMRGRDIVRFEDIWSQVDFNNPNHYLAVADSIKRAQASGAGSGQ